MTRSAYWQTTALRGATYFVAVDPPLAIGLRRAVVPAGTVEMRQHVDLGTIILPVSGLAPWATLGRGAPLTRMVGSG